MAHIRVVPKSQNDSNPKKIKSTQIAKSSATKLPRITPVRSKKIRIFAYWLKSNNMIKMVMIL